ncbi:transposable element Tcb2 transposase [Trichonephila clavipes]|nr:transposable element Tcb2 transposase [Trichonephila clavipes]
MDKLNNSKRAIKCTITKIETFVEESGNHTRTKLDIKLKRVQEMNRIIHELKDQYYDIKDISESELQVIEADIQSMEDRLEELEVRIRDILNSLIAKSSVSSVHSHENTISQTNSKLKLEIKLPEIPLPVFRGRYDEWPSFKSQFDNIISNNNDLSESQKLYYLKASLQEGGQAQAEVAQAIGVSQSVIPRIRNRFLETGSAGRRRGQGRRRATTPNEDRYLVLTDPRHRNINATLLQQHLRSASGTTVSTQNVRNRLHGVGLYPRRPMECVRLTSRDIGNRNNPAFVHESVRFGGGEVLVYGGISIDGRTDLYIIRDGPLTARRYRDEIIRPIVVPYAAGIGDDFILMEDNCRPHRANLVDDFLFEEGVVRIEWPACSPDMNLIEHIWDALGK